MAESRLTLYAWVGMDERGSGRIGLKQGLVPAGMIPLVAMDYHRDRLERVTPQMEAQAAAFGQRIYLARFVLESVDLETAAGEPWNL